MGPTLSSARNALVTTETSVIAFFVWCGDGWLFPCRRAILAVGLPAGALLVDLLWSGLLWPARPGTHGDLIRQAEQEGYQLLTTTDTNLLYQQNLKDRNLAILVLTTTVRSWSTGHHPRPVLELERRKDAAAVWLKVARL
jgi:hypothetical protein